MKMEEHVAKMDAMLEVIRRNGRPIESSTVALIEAVRDISAWIATHSPREAVDGA